MQVTSNGPPVTLTPNLNTLTRGFAAVRRLLQLLVGISRHNMLIRAIKVILLEGDVIQGRLKRRKILLLCAEQRLSLRRQRNSDALQRADISSAAQLHRPILDHDIGSDNRISALQARRLE